MQWLKENNHFKTFNPYAQDGKPDWGRIYGHVFEAHFREPTAQQEIIEEAIGLSQGKINWAHLCLGELVSKRYVHTVLTTNFDQLVLDGIIRTGIIPVVADGVESLSRIKPTPSYPQVIHIHGSRHTYNPRNSSSALNAVKNETIAISSIIGILQEAKAFVVVGYAGGEEGVIEILIEAAKKLNEPTIYWVMHDKHPDKLSPKAKELLQHSSIKSPICGQDADAFFAQLMSGLGLGKPEWMKAPINTLLCNAARIAEVDNSDIKAILADYRAHIEQLEKCGQIQPERSMSEEIMLKVSELRLKGKDKEAANYLRANITDIDSAEAWRQLGELEIEIGKYEAEPNRLKQAIEALKNSLKKIDSKAAPLDWATTQCSLSEALWRLGEREKGTERLESSVKICRQTLEKITKSDAPLLWAKLQQNLGIALILLGQRESGTETLEKAIEACEAALSERTRERVPLDWAATQNNFGNALVRLGERENNANNIEEAIIPSPGNQHPWAHSRSPMDMMVQG